MGVPPVIIHFRLGFSNKKTIQLLGYPPPFMEIGSIDLPYIAALWLCSGGSIWGAPQRWETGSLHAGRTLWSCQDAIQIFEHSKWWKNWVSKTHPEIQVNYIIWYYSMFSANFCRNWRRIFSCSACSALNPSFQKGSQRWITTFWRQRYWWDPMGCQVVTMTLNKKLLQTSWSCGDIPILCQPKKVEMQLKRGPQLVAKRMGVDCWLAGLCWFMVSSLSLSLSIYI